MSNFAVRDSKNMQSAKSKVDLTKFYTLEDAVKILQQMAYVKFDSSLEVAINLGVDPRHSDQMVRGVVSLPHGTGKNVRVAVICKEDKFSVAQEAGADIVGASDIIEDIKNGKIEFDVCIATPDMMGVIGSVARILGPKGLMPNPKLGTVTTDIAKAVNNVKSGQVEFRVEKAGIVHAALGKLSFSDGHLVDNVNTFIDAIIKAKPSGSKGVYLKSITLSSTMGPGIKITLP